MESWTALRIDVAADAADAVAAFLFDHGVSGVLTGIEEAGGRGQAPGRATLEAHVPTGRAPAIADALRAHLDRLGAIEPAWAGGRLATMAEPAIDWTRAFRDHHRPIRVGTRLLVAPPWDVPTEVGRITLVVEPGMAFGTGQHATTRTCLEEIDALAAGGGVRSMLDVGTGSGILAAAAARLGVPRVAAVDIDPTVLPLARATLVRNGVPGALLAGGDVRAMRGPFDLVVANLLLDAVLADGEALAAAVAPDGTLIVSGLLDEQVGRATAAFAGWRVALVRADERWRTLRLVRSG